MSKLETLIKEHCPNGVEYKALGELGELVRGNGLQKTDFTESGVGCIHYGQIYTYYGTFTALTKSFVSPKLAQTLKKVNKNDLIITNTSENIEDVCKAVAWLGEDEIVTGGHATIFKHNENAKYLAYYMQTPMFFDEKRQHVTGVKVIDVSASKLAKIKIPIPPLPIQREIVCILDTFTELTAELTTQLAAELEARKKQYESYRDTLLTFGDEVEWKTLGEVSRSITTGVTPLAKNSDYYNGDIPWLRTQEVRYIDIIDTEIKITQKALKETSLKWVPKNSVIVAISGATAGRVGINKIPLTTNQHCCCLEVNKEKALYRYVFHCILNKNEDLLKLKQGARGDLNTSLIKNFKIPIPPLAEQERIVAILDRFDALTHDISIGLPAEIAARKQQYEYYRDQLLTFKEVSP